MRLSARLPTHSRYKAALLVDEDWADAVALVLEANIDDDGAKAVSAEEWTREQDMLANIADLLQGIRSVLIAANSRNGKAPKVHPVQRPTTALEKAQNRAVKRRHLERVAELTGGRRDA